MKKLTKKVSAFIARQCCRAEMAAIKLAVRVSHAKHILASNTGEGYIDTAIKILIAVVLGALLLAGLYALFGDVVMPTLKQRIQEMFSYAG